jgi:hypothetical protein
VSVYFTYLAAELAEIAERLAEDDLAPLSAELRQAISEAYVEACAAERAALRALDPEDEAPRAADAA